MSQIESLGCFIDGVLVPLDGLGFDLLDPQDGSPVAHLTEAGEHGVAYAVERAATAFRTHRASTRHQRATWLRAAADAVMKANDRLAEIISRDVGKPIRVARIEVRRGAEFLEACAGVVLNIGGEEVVPLDAAAAGAGHFGFTRRVPFGVVGAITPFNAPLNLLVQKVGPAIAAGNAVVAKPAPSGTRTALALAALCVEAGWPAGLFNVVPGDRATALALAAHPGVGAISFTGGTAAGEALVKVAGLKKFVAELGSNAANIVLADADVQGAASRIAAAAFEASGQQCISAQRVLVEQPVFEPFLAAFVEAAGKLKVGRADDPATDIGPMVHRGAADRVMAMVEDALARGARSALEGRQDRCTVSPSILVDVARDARLWREEVFGPVALVTAVADIDEALRLANDSPFGLQGAVFTRSLSSAFRFSDEFDVGALWVNEASRFRLDMYPFGGMKLSGTGREGVRYAIEELSQIKFTGIRP